LNPEGRIARRADKDQLDFDILKSPIVQAKEWGTSGAYDWQKAVWMACWQKNARVAVKTCNSSGKTSMLVPILALSWMSAFPGSKVVITSANERDIEEQLMPSFENAIAPYRKNGWKKVGMNIIAPSIDGVLPPSKTVCFCTKSGKNFEGHHNKLYFDADGVERFCPLLVIVDEAKSVADDIFHAVTKCKPTVQLRISTTGADSGGFHDAAENSDGTWTTGTEFNGEYHEFTIPWTLCPHLMDDPGEYAQSMAMIERYGVNHPEVKSQLLAEFFRSGTMMVMSDHDLRSMSDCAAGGIPHIPGQRVAFCDLSGGGDECTFGFRDGNLIHPIEIVRRGSDTPPSVTAKDYIALFKKYGLTGEQVYCDNGGLGAEIIKQIRAYGYNVTPVNFATGAIDKKKFKSRIAEQHWLLKELVNDKKLILPRDKKLMEQAKLRRYTMKNDDSNQIALEKKRKRGEDSPDRLETVVGLLIRIDMSKLPGASDYRKLEESATLCPSTKEVMRQIAAESHVGDDGFFGGGWGC